MPMPVSRDREGDDRRRLGERLVSGGPSRRSATPMLDVDLAALGELEGVGEQVLEDLAEPLGVGDDVARASRAPRRSSSRGPLPRATWLELAEQSACGTARRDSSASSTTTVPDSTLARSRMLLRRSSRSLPEARMTLAYSTWVVGHVVVGVVLELLGEDQQAVERGAQLVGHVGDELGLVLRRDGQLAGLLLDAAAWTARPPGSSARPRCSARRAAWPAARGPRWTRAAPPAGSAAPRPATGTA